MIMNNKLYDALKDTALLLPLVITLYLALSDAWHGFPHATEVAGTLLAVNAFIGALVKICQVRYNGPNNPTAPAVTTPEV